MGSIPGFHLHLPDHMHYFDAGPGAKENPTSNSRQTTRKQPGASSTERKNPTTT
jgi:hypothetical protein